MASGAGAVRVRPTGLTASPSMKRYQYQRAGSRPVTSTWTLCASAGWAVAAPLAAMRVKAWSCATSQRTFIATGAVDAAFNGSARMRVHRTTESGSGEPEATPRLNGYADGRAVSGGAIQPSAAPSRKKRRCIERRP